METARAMKEEPFFAPALSLFLFMTDFFLIIFCPTFYVLLGRRVMKNGTREGARELCL
jgi:hypothetical protein